MIPAWRALPLWAKIVTFPMILSAAVTIVVMAAYTLIGVFYAIAAAFDAVSGWFGKAAKETNKVINAATA